MMNSKFLKQSSHYFIGQTLIMLSGFISFPILTRILSIEEYGLLSLFSSILLIGTAVGKMGLSNSSVRFYTEIKSLSSRKRYFSTHFFAELIASTGTGIAFLLFSILYLSEDQIADSLTLIIFISLSLIFKSMLSLLLSFLRAEQNTIRFNFILVLQKYGMLIASLAVMFMFVPGLEGFFLGMVSVEGALVLYLSLKIIKEENLDFHSFSSNELISNIKYGLPLVLSELAYVLFERTDTFMINHFLGIYEIGLYSVVYNLGYYLQKIAIIPLSMTVMPLYLSIWKEKGATETSKFLSKITNYYLVCIIPLGVGLSLFATDIITLLASPKYAEAAHLMPWIISGLLLYGVYYLYAAGFYVSKKSGAITLSIFVSLFMNIVLNLFLIPLLGLKGAAISTLLSYLVLILFTLLKTKNILPIRLNYKLLMHSVISTLLTFSLVLMINIEDLFFELLIKFASGFIIYLFIMIILNKEFRREFLKIGQRVIRKNLLSVENI